jgi:hypothetical protein
MKQAATVVGGMVAAVCLLGGSPASACSGPHGCEGSGVYPLGEAMPSWSRALEWTSPTRALPTTGVRLERVDVETESWREVPVDLTAGATPDVLTIRPREGFLPDTRYRLTTPASECPGRVTGASQAFRTGGPAALPTALGALGATAPALANVQQRMPVGAQCAYEASAVVSVVSVSLAAEAAPWAAMLAYEVRVDGAPFVGLVERGYPLVQPPPGGTHAGRGRARLAVICGPSTDPLRSSEPVSLTDGLAEGEHEVVFRARVVGTATVLEAAPLRVTLRCPPAGVDAGIGSVDAGGLAGDAGVADVGAADAGAADAGAADAGAADAGTADATGAAPTGGCSVGGHRNGAAPWALAAALALASARRRRRRRAEVSPARGGVVPP